MQISTGVSELNIIFVSPNQKKKFEIGACARICTRGKVFKFKNHRGLKYKKKKLKISTNGY